MKRLKILSLLSLLLMIPISCRKSVEAVDHSFSFEVSFEETQEEDRIIVLSVQAGAPSDVFKIKYTIDGGTELELMSEGKTVAQEDILKLVEGKASLFLPFLASGSHDVSVTLYNGYEVHTETITFVKEIRVKSIQVEPQTLDYGRVSFVSMTVTPVVHDTPIIASGYDDKVIKIVKINNEINRIFIRPLSAGKTRVTLSAGTVTTYFEVTVIQAVSLFILSEDNHFTGNSIYAYLDSPISDDLYVYCKLEFNSGIEGYYKENDRIKSLKVSVSGENKLNNESHNLLISESDYITKVNYSKKYFLENTSSTRFHVYDGILYVSTKFSNNEDCYELKVYYPEKYCFNKPEFNLDPLKHEYVPYEKYLKLKW